MLMLLRLRKLVYQIFKYPASVYVVQAILSLLCHGSSHQATVVC